MKMSVNLLEENLPGLLQPSKYNHLSEDEVISLAQRHFVLNPIFNR